MEVRFKQKIIRRLKLLEGQVRGLQKMVEEERYCVDIIHQSSAIKQALSSVEDLVLENHLKTHVVNQIQSGKRGKATKEILEIYKLAKRK